MSDDLIIAIVTLAVAVLFTALWWIAAYVGVKRAIAGRASPIWATLPVQLSALAFAYATLRAGLLVALLAILSPPLTGVWAGQTVHTALGPLVTATLPVTLPVALAASALCLLIRPLRWVWLCGAALAATTTFLITADNIAGDAMCARAEAAGLTNVTRHSLSWSIRNTGHEFQFDLHAMASLGEDNYGWSYSEMDWYLIPENVVYDAPRTAPSCL